MRSAGRFLQQEHRIASPPVDTWRNPAAATSNILESNEDARQPRGARSLHTDAVQRHNLLKITHKSREAVAEHSAVELPARTNTRRPASAVAAAHTTAQSKPELQGHEPGRPKSAPLLPAAGTQASKAAGELRLGRERARSAQRSSADTFSSASGSHSQHASLAGSSSRRSSPSTGNPKTLTAAGLAGLASDSDRSGSPAARFNSLGVALEATPASEARLDAAILRAAAQGGTNADNDAACGSSSSGSSGVGSVSVSQRVQRSAPRAHDADTKQARTVAPRGAAHGAADGVQQQAITTDRLAASGGMAGAQQRRNRPGEPYQALARDYGGGSGYKVHPPASAGTPPCLLPHDADNFAPSSWHDAC